MSRSALDFAQFLRAWRRAMSSDGFVLKTSLGPASVFLLYERAEGSSKISLRNQQEHLGFYSRGTDQPVPSEDGYPPFPSEQVGDSVPSGVQRIQVPQIVQLICQLHQFSSVGCSGVPAPPAAAFSSLGRVLSSVTSSTRRRTCPQSAAPPHPGWCLCPPLCHGAGLPADRPHSVLGHHSGAQS